MSNMSYCRFTNTRGDMEDCLEAIRNEKNLSDFEAQAGKNMFQDILEFCQEYGIIDTFDNDVLQEIFRHLQEQIEDDE